MTKKQDKKSFFCTLTDVNFNKLMDGRIPKLDMDSITMYQSLDRAWNDSVYNIRLRVDEERIKDRKESHGNSKKNKKPRKKVYKGIYVTIELEYDIDTLINYHFNKNMVAPTAWLIEQGIVDKSFVSEDMYALLMESYENSDFDFYGIVIQKEDIVSAHKIDWRRSDWIEKVI